MSKARVWMLDDGAMYTVVDAALDEPTLTRFIPGWVGISGIEYPERHETILVKDFLTLRHLLKDNIKEVPQ